MKVQLFSRIDVIFLFYNNEFSLIKDLFVLGLIRFVYQKNKHRQHRYRPHLDRWQYLNNESNECLAK